MNEEKDTTKMTDLGPLADGSKIETVEVDEELRQKALEAKRKALEAMTATHFTEESFTKNLLYGLRNRDVIRGEHLSQYYMAHHNSFIVPTEEGWFCVEAKMLNPRQLRAYRETKPTIYETNLNILEYQGGLPRVTMDLPLAVRRYTEENKYWAPAYAILRRQDHYRDWEGFANPVDAIKRVAEAVGKGEVYGLLMNEDPERVEMILDIVANMVHEEEDQGDWIMTPDEIVPMIIAVHGVLAVGLWSRSHVSWEFKDGKVRYELPPMMSENTQQEEN